MEEWAYIQFDNHKKGKSTVRAKCRSVWNWYDTQNWELPKHTRKRKFNTLEEIEELRMTRQERALSNAKAKAEKARKKVIHAITGLYADEYKKKSGAWHIKNIANSINLDPRVVSKYLKEWEEEQVKKEDKQ